MPEASLQFCPECGYEHGGARYCPRCGAPQPTSDRSSSDAPGKSQQSTQTKVSALIPPASVPVRPPSRRVRRHWLLHARTRREKFKQLGVYTVAMLLFGVMLDQLSTPTNTGISTNPAVSDSPAQPAAPSRCYDVPRDIVFNLEQGLTITGGGSVSNVQAVRSNDFKMVWFVSGDLEGAGMEGEQLATWATNSLDPQQPAGFASVNDVALKHSSWANGPNTDAQLSMNDDGAEESQECASASGP